MGGINTDTPTSKSTPPVHFQWLHYSYAPPGPTSPFSFLVLLLHLALPRLFPLT